MGQRTRILVRLKAGHTITQKQAIQWWECYRLASRIQELRDQGHVIVTEMVKGKKTRYARYKLVA